MASVNKCPRYPFVKEITTSDEESCDDTYYPPSIKNLQSARKTITKSGRKQKCFSKNALLARENRLKKKIYMTNLENEVNSLRGETQKLTKIVDNQSLLISGFKNEIKYLKSVIANSSDISKLIQNIHQSTGMSVSSSLDKNISLKNVCVPKRKLPIARKTAHPWEEMQQFSSYPTPESNCLSSSNDDFQHEELSEILNDVPLDFALDIPQAELMDDLVLKQEECIEKHTETFNEHNYTTPIPDLMESDDNSNDVGVCVHFSKHRLSLEFCSSCSENATRSWIN